MLLMASGGFGIPQVAKNFPDNSGWNFFGFQCEHAVGGGGTLWDLIQPAFMFMVGVALPWSVANRQRRGQSYGVMFGHALARALLLAFTKPRTQRLVASAILFAYWLAFGRRSP